MKKFVIAALFSCIAVAGIGSAAQSGFRGDGMSTAPVTVAAGAWAGAGPETVRLSDIIWH